MPLAADNTGTVSLALWLEASPVTIAEVILVGWRFLNPPHPSVLASSHS
jgi:hypothetical protein